MAIVKELKNLGKKMTGADLTGNTVSEALKAIEEKYTGGGTPEPTYEVVAEIAVSAEHKAEVSDVPEWAHMYVVPNCESQALAIDDTDDRNITMYFNDAAYPLHKDGGMFFHNMTIVDELPARVEEAAPAFGIGFSEDSSFSAQIVSSEDLSDTTVKILKKVEQSGGEESPIEIIHVKATEFSESLEPTAAVLEDSVDEFKAAIESGKPVIVDFDFSGAYGQNYDASHHWYSGGSASVLRAGSVESWMITCTFDLGGSEAIDLFVAISERDGEIDEQECKTTARKPTYEFGFTATYDSQTGYTATADEGSAYAAISDALAKTPLVFANIHNQTGQTISARFSSGNQLTVQANAIGKVDEGFVGVWLKVANDDSIEFVTLPLNG